MVSSWGVMGWGLTKCLEEDAPAGVLEFDGVGLGDFGRGMMSHDDFLAKVD